jgi:hypothetical protein
MSKRLLLFFALLLTTVGGGLFYIWYRATHVPSWYTQTNPPNQAFSVASTEPWVPEWQKITNQVVESLRKQGNQGKIELSASEVNTLVAYGFDTTALNNAEATNQMNVKKIVLGTNTKFQDGKMIVGAMVNLKQLAQRQLSKDGQGDATAQALLRLPFVGDTTKWLPGDQAVYVEVEGKPTVKNGNIALEPNSQVTIAGFGSTLPELAKNLKIPATTLEDRIINRAIRLPMKVEAIEIVNERLIATGSATAF